MIRMRFRPHKRSISIDFAQIHAWPAKLRLSVTDCDWPLMRSVICIRLMMRLVIFENIFFFEKKSQWKNNLWRSASRFAWGPVCLFLLNLWRRSFWAVQIWKQSTQRQAASRCSVGAKLANFAPSRSANQISVACRGQWHAINCTACFASLELSDSQPWWWSEPSTSRRN